MKKKFLVFTAETLGCAVFNFVGSVIGHRFGGTAVFTGGLLGGVLGIVLTTRMLTKTGVIERQQYSRTTAFGIVGFLVAAVLALSNLNAPVVPLLSLGLVGTGAVLGSTGDQGTKTCVSLCTAWTVTAVSRLVFYRWLGCQVQLGSSPCLYAAGLAAGKRRAPALF